MTLRDFGWLSLVCMIWGLNIIVTRWVFLNSDIQPVFYAGIRFALIALVLTPFLFRRIPEQIGRLFLISMCMGAAHFGLLFIGFANASGSASAVVGQMGVPFTTLLSIIFLNEKVGWRRGLGITLAFAGVLIISVDPANFDIETGLFFIIAAAFVGSVGSILMKQINPLPAINMQAWVGAMSFIPLFGVSILMHGFEGGFTDQFAAFADAKPMVWVATAFAVLGVSIFGHGSFYTLIKRYEVTLLSPLTLQVPLWGVIFSVIILHEKVDIQFLIGGAVSLLGVLIIAVRRNTKLPFASVAKKMVGGS